MVGDDSPDNSVDTLVKDRTESRIARMGLNITYKSETIHLETLKDGLLNSSQMGLVFEIYNQSIF